jgi:hypothetical protein
VRNMDAARNPGVRPILHCRENVQGRASMLAPTRTLPASNRIRRRRRLFGFFVGLGRGRHALQAAQQIFLGHAVE